MRKIEQRMVEALRTGASYQEDNTTVTSSGDVFLYGNQIARVVNGVVEVNEDILRRYPTNTTKSRLRALGVSVTQKDFSIYLNGKEL